MLGYIRGLNRRIKINDYPINLFKDSMFTDKKFGLIPVLDNRFAKQQANGAVAKDHNTLHREDLIKILDHAVCDPRTSLGYLYRYIISFGIALGVRPTAIWEITTDQFCKTTVQGMNFYMYTERIGSKTGGSKTKKGGIKYISRAPVQIPLFDVTLLNGCLRFYEMYEHFLSIRPKYDSKRVFLQLNRGETKP